MLIDCKTPVPSVPDAFDMFGNPRSIKIYFDEIVTKIQIWNEKFGSCENEGLFCKGYQKDRIVLDSDETIVSITYGRSERHRNFPCRLSIQTSKRVFGPFAETNCSSPHYRAENLDNYSALDFFEKYAYIRMDNGTDIFDGFSLEKYYNQEADNFIGFYFDNSSASNPIDLEFRMGLS